jgi:hypothetical protein
MMKNVVITLELFVGLFLALVIVSLATGCSSTRKRIMVNCEQKSGDFWECEEP